MRKSGILIILLLTLSTLSLNAQRESFNWYFGSKAAITFNPNGTPSRVNNSAMQTGRGCAAISDSCTGQLYFYTNGEVIYNTNHVVMPNGSGLDGDDNSTQSALIVPHPDGSLGEYYVFTVERNKGLKYSVVDMNLNGGLGDVISGKKNVPLIFPTLEKITAVRHQNNQWVWIIARPLDSTNFYSYLFTDTGLIKDPVISQTSVTYGNNGAIGYMKASPNGRLLALASQGDQRFDLYDFDNATGIVSNARSTGSHYSFAYGVEFSPDASKLYVTSNPGGLWQYDLNTVLPGKPLGDSTFIDASPNVAIQLGPDGQIYCNEIQSFLGAILFPNRKGTACDYQTKYLKVNGHTGSGLPTFMQSYFSPMSIIEEGICLGITTTFSLSHDRSLDSISWNFGDPGSGILNTSKIFNTSHLYDDTGTYTVTAFVYSTECGLSYRDTVIKDVEIIFRPIPVVDLGDDTIICAEDNITLSTDGTEPSYIWSTGSKESSISINAEGTYWVRAINECGGISDTIEISHFQSNLNVNLGKDTALCQGQIYPLNITQQGAEYVWSTGSTSGQIIASQPGTYWAQASDLCYSQADTIEIRQKFKPAVELGDDTTICDGISVELNAQYENSTYKWQDLSDLPTFTADEEGVYRVQVTNSCGSVYDDIFILTEDCACNVFIPNSFTPNSDGLNDVLRIENNCQFFEFQLDIYNRWGELIFRSKDPSVTWDGRTGNSKEISGLYRYHLTYRSTDPFKPETLEKRGNIFLVD